MTKQVSRVAISANGKTFVDAPAGAEIINVGVHDGTASIWFLGPYVPRLGFDNLDDVIDPELGIERRAFLAVETGEAVPDKAKYVGTIYPQYWNYQVHVFEV